MAGENSELARLEIAIAANYSEFKDAMTKIKDEAKESGRGLSSEFAEAGKAMAIGLSAPIIAKVTEVVFSVNSIQGAVQKLRAGVADTGADFDRLRGSFLNVLKGTDMPVQETAQAVAALRARTDLAGPSLEALAGQFLNLNSLAGESAATLIGPVTQAFRKWEVAGKDMGDTLDLLFRAHQESGASIALLTTEITENAAILKALGYDIVQSIALFAQWEKSGYNVAIMMSGIRNAMANFSLHDIKDVPGEIKGIFESIKNAGTDAQASALAVEFFGHKAGEELSNALRSGGFEIDGFSKKLRDGKSTIEAVNKETDTFGSFLENLKNRLVESEAPLASVQKKFQEAASEGMEPLFAAFKKMNEGFAGMSTGAQLAIGSVVGVAAAVGPTAIAMDTLINVIANLKTIFHATAIEGAALETVILADGTAVTTAAAAAEIAAGGGIAVFAAGLVAATVAGVALYEILKKIKENAPAITVNGVVAQGQLYSNAGNQTPRPTDINGVVGAPATGGAGLGILENAAQVTPEELKAITDELNGLNKAELRAKDSADLFMESSRQAFDPGDFRGYGDAFDKISEQIVNAFDNIKTASTEATQQSEADLAKLRLQLEFTKQEAKQTAEKYNPKLGIADYFEKTYAELTNAFQNGELDTKGMDEALDQVGKDMVKTYGTDAPAAVADFQDTVEKAMAAMKASGQDVNLDLVTVLGSIKLAMADLNRLKDKAEEAGQLGTPGIGDPIAAWRKQTAQNIAGVDVTPDFSLGSQIAKDLTDSQAPQLLDNLKQKIEEAKLLGIVDAQSQSILTAQFWNTLSVEQRKAVGGIIGNIKDLSPEAVKAFSEMAAAQKKALDTKAIQTFAGQVGGLGSAIGGLGPKFQTIGKVISTASGLVSGFAGLMQALPLVMQAAATAGRLAWESMLGPLGLVLEAITQIITALGIFGGKTKKEAEGMDKIWKDLGDAVNDWGKQFTDVLVEFVKTGKLTFKDLADSILSDLLRITIQESIVTPLIKFGKSALGFAKGGAFEGGRVIPMAKGHLTSGPEYFGMGGGNIGLRGEAGTEAVMPLARTSGGELGVKIAASAGGGGVSMEVHNYTTAQISTTQSTGADGRQQVKMMVLDIVNAGAMEGMLSGVGRAFGIGLQPVLR